MIITQFTIGDLPKFVLLANEIHIYNVYMKYLKK